LRCFLDGYGIEGAGFDAGAAEVAALLDLRYIIDYLYRAERANGLTRAAAGTFITVDQYSHAFSSWPVDIF
jgi:hypothetical protein